jgi:formylglycine-generating enzyme required for sulfatase activity
MGCSPGDNECESEENPAHQVTITKGFWIGQTPVTVGAYKRFAGATGRQMPPAPAFNSGWRNDNMPIVNVDWNDAQAYCGWMGGRLPTEAEWEYAARGGSTAARYGPLDDVAWYYNNSGRQRLDSARILKEEGGLILLDRAEANGNGTHDVGEKRANGFGLYDMLGNVEEWVNDWYGNYQDCPSQDPHGPASGDERVLRGGSWCSNSGFVRVSNRNWHGPDPLCRDSGFRCGGEAGNP